MAMDDIRDLKARNAELQRQLLEAQSAAGASRRAAPAASDSGTDWEAQKRRLLAELESDDQHDAESTDRRLKIEEIVARTDKIIAEKNREIEELQHLLNNQSNSLGSPGAWALRPWSKCSTRTRSSARSGSGFSSCRTSVKTSSARPRSSLPWSGHGLARREAEIEEKLRNADIAASIGRGRGLGADRPAGPRPLADAVGPDR